MRICSLVPGATEVVAALDLDALLFPGVAGAALSAGLELSVTGTSFFSSLLAHPATPSSAARATAVQIVFTAVPPGDRVDRWALCKPSSLSAR